MARPTSPVDWVEVDRQNPAIRCQYLQNRQLPSVTCPLTNAIHIVGVTGGQEFLPGMLARDVTIAAAIRLAIWETSFRDVEIKRIAIMARQPRIRHC